VAAYRPLIEFCLGLPTDQFVRDGVDRWLARRLAEGRMPEEQRTNSLYGRTNADWHTRMTPRLGELRAEAERLRDDPVMSELVDVDRLVGLLDDWPECTPVAWAEMLPREVAATRAILAGRFMRQITGRNG